MISTITIQQFRSECKKRAGKVGQIWAIAVALIVFSRGRAGYRRESPMQEESALINIQSGGSAKLACGKRNPDLPPCRIIAVRIVADESWYF